MSLNPFLTIQELRKRLDAHEVTPQEVLDYYIQRFEKFDAQLGSALEIFDKESIIKSRLQSSGPLSGIPGLIKDNITQVDRIASCGSKILQNYHATYDATVCERLKNQGAFLIGRANMDEFAMGSSNERSAYKNVKNPWDLSRVPGGSSGGSAAAVSAGLIPWALGSETGGSVRQPAAFCGITGIKPTYGLISRYGLIAYASSLDQVGVLARSVYDSALVLSAIAGQDTKDSSTLAVKPTDYTKNLTGSLKPGLRIGVVENALYAEGMDNEIVSSIENALKVYEKLGAQIKRVTIPVLDYSAAAYFVISRAEAASNLARFDGVRYGLRVKNKTLADMYQATRHDGFGSEVRARIMVGSYVLSAGHAGEFYVNAQKVQRLIRHELRQALADVDVLVMPTHPAPAFTIGAFDVDKLQMDLQDYFTCPANLAGIPALSIPCGFTQNNLPIGFQLWGSHLSEELLLQTAYAYEQQTEWHKKFPEKFI